MIDRATAETVIYRTAITAFAYPQSTATLGDDTAWCLEPLDADLQGAFRDAVRDAITDPTAGREHLVTHLMNLVPTQ